MIRLLYKDKNCDNCTDNNDVYNNLISNEKNDQGTKLTTLSNGSRKSCIIFLRFQLALYSTECLSWILYINDVVVIYSKQIYKNKDINYIYLLYKRLHSIK